MSDWGSAKQRYINPKLLIPLCRPVAAPSPPRPNQATFCVAAAYALARFGACNPGHPYGTPPAWKLAVV
ncbi:hypothetical protein N7522_001462 [Penicillium canescens]|nr:hypothetical protein N7522_001462 [Penicillium canescens]